MINEQHILEAENQLIESIKTRDITQLATLIHDDLLFIIPDGTVITKEIDLASHRAGHMIVTSLETNYENIRIIGDNAVVTVLVATKGTMMGNPMDVQLRYIRVWKMVADRLQIIGGSCTAIAS